MQRRDFIQKGITGAAALGTAGCSAFSRRKFKFKSDRSLPEPPEEFLKVTVPKPSGGTMPIGEIGTTGIKVSKFAFGAHISKELLPFTKEREEMVMEAYDLGINLFDVYEQDWKIYQYEPMGRYLAPIINDVIISIDIVPYDGRTAAQEFERALKLLGRDYMDMVRLHQTSPEQSGWGNWETLLKYKEQGKIRALGIPVHFEKEAEIVLKEIPIDYVIFPYNFYHNLLWTGKITDTFDPLAERLRKKGIGVITMKPFGSDDFVYPLIDAARKLDKTGELSFPQAALKYVLNSGLNPDTTLGGMYTLNQVYENVAVCYNPEMSSEENELLNKLRKVSRFNADAWSSDYYKFLEKWASDYPDEGNLHV